MREERGMENDVPLWEWVGREDEEEQDNLEDCVHWYGITVIILTS